MYSWTFSRVKSRPGIAARPLTQSVMVSCSVATCCAIGRLRFFCDRKAIKSKGDRKAIKSKGDRKAIKSKGDRKAIKSKGDRKAVDRAIHAEAGIASKL